VSARAYLHRCGCGALYIASFEQKACIGCRRAAALERFRRYTDQRSADRAEAREGLVCDRCGEALPVERRQQRPHPRSTRRYCSNACRQAAYRERERED
jgi:hypothetical protein